MGKYEEQVLEQLAEVNRLWAKDEDQDILDAAEESLNNLILQDNPKFSQAEFVKYMQLAADAAWDIPSALFMICPEGADMLEEFDSMHRPSVIFPGDGTWYETLEPWEPTDQHFLNAHNLDLKDPDINWGFST